MAPKVRAFVDDLAEPVVAEKVERRLGHWVQRRINALFEPMLKMQADEAITGLARGVAFQIAESMGVIPRRRIANDVKTLGQEERAQLRKHGVRFGQHHVFMPALLKPAPTRLRLILWSLWEGFEALPDVPPPGMVTIPAVEDAPEGYYGKVGYRLCGPRALRIDMLERLTDLIRPMDAKAGFEATPDMLSITGCTLEQFAELMQGLGYDAERGERVRAPRAERTDEAAPAGSAAAETATGAAAAPGGADPSAAPGRGSEGNPAEEPFPAAAELGAPAAVDAGIPPAAEPTPAARGEPEAASVEVSSGATAEAEAASTGAAQDEPETEVFFVFRLRQRRGPAPARKGGGKERPSRDSRRAKGKGPRGENGEAGAKGAPKPQRRQEKPADPDSPFAILKELKLK